MLTGDAAEVTDPVDLISPAREPSEVILVEVPLAFEPASLWRRKI